MGGNKKKMVYLAMLLLLLPYTVLCVELYVVFDGNIIEASIPTVFLFKSCISNNCYITENGCTNLCPLMNFGEECPFLIVCLLSIFCSMK